MVAEAGSSAHPWMTPVRCSEIMDSLLDDVLFNRLPEVRVEKLRPTRFGPGLMVWFGLVTHLSSMLGASVQRRLQTN